MDDLAARGARVAKERRATRFASVVVAVAVVAMSCSSGPPSQIAGGAGWRFVADGSAGVPQGGNYLLDNDADLAARIDDSLFGEVVEVDFGREAVLWLNYIGAEKSCATSVVSSVEVVGNTVKVTLESWSAQEFCEAIGVFYARLLAIDRETVPADPFFVQFNDREPEPVLLIEPDS